MRQLDGNTDLMDMSLCKFRKIVKDRGDWWGAVHGFQRARHDLVTELQQPYFHKTIGSALP